MNKKLEVPKRMPLTLSNALDDAPGRVSEVRTQMERLESIATRLQAAASVLNDSLSLVLRPSTQPDLPIEVKASVPLAAEMEAHINHLEMAWSCLSSIHDRLEL